MQPKHLQISLCKQAVLLLCILFVVLCRGCSVKHNRDWFSVPYRIFFVSSTWKKDVCNYKSQKNLSICLVLTATICNNANYRESAFYGSIEIYFRLLYCKMTKTFRTKWFYEKSKLLKYRNKNTITAEQNCPSIKNGLFFLQGAWCDESIESHHNCIFAPSCTKFRLKKSWCNLEIVQATHYD